MIQQQKKCRDCNNHGFPDEHEVCFCPAVGGHCYLGSLACNKFDDTVCF